MPRVQAFPFQTLFHQQHECGRRLSVPWLLHIPTCEMIFNHRKAVAASPAAEEETTGRQKTVAGVMDKRPLGGEVALSPAAIRAATSQHMLNAIDEARVEWVVRGREPERLPGPVVEVGNLDFSRRVPTTLN